MGPVKADRWVRARVAAAGNVLEGEDQPTLSALYYDNHLTASVILVAVGAAFDGTIIR